MLGVGLGELVLLLAVGILVIGPADLPELARTVGAFFLQIRQAADNARQEVQKAIDPVVEDPPAEDVAPHAVTPKRPG